MRLFVVIAGLALLLALLMSRFPGALHNDQDVSNLLYMVLLLVMVSSGLFARRNITWKQHTRYAAGWLAIGLALLIGYSFYGDISARLKRELLPASAETDGSGSIRLKAQANGHFYVEVEVNHTLVTFMIDTGASSIALSQADAARAGLLDSALNYTIPSNTANGISFSAPVTIDSLAVDGLLFQKVPATIDQGRLDFSLLGMSFLRRFTSYTFKGDELILVP